VTPLCEALVALGMGLGLCGDLPNATPPLPVDEPKAWSVPEKKEPPVMPPPVIIREVVREIVREPAPLPPPPPPNPYQALLSRTLGGGDGYPPSSIDGIDGEQTPEKPPAFAALALPSDLALGAPAMASKYRAPGSKSGLPVDNERILAADRYITGIMETGINSQLESSAGGSAIIQVSRDIFGYHGRKILVPKGSRMICDYKPPKKQGETRIAFTCNRILMGMHRAEILSLGAKVGDVQGHGGVSGEIDNRFWEKYGTAFVLAGVSAAVRLSSSALTAGSSTSTNQSAIAQTTDKGSQELSQKLGEITASVLESTVNLVPIIKIAQGTRVQIRPSTDWYIRRIGEADTPEEEDTSQNPQKEKRK
jgi:type IV secretion system protein VirB10